MDRKDFIENVLGGIFAIIAVGAAIAEVIINGVSASTVVAGIKDVFGTLVVVLVFIAFINEKKRTKNVRESIELAMEKVEKSYAPLIREEKASENTSVNKQNKLNKIIRYEIAANTGVLFGDENKLYSPFFELSATNAKSVDFYIRKKFFGDTERKPFEAERIADRISKYIQKNNKELEVGFMPDSYGGKIIVKFSDEIKYKNDVEKLISLVNDAIFAYVAENKK